MKKLPLLLLLLLAVFFAAAQKKEIDTLRLALSKAKTDTMRYVALSNLSWAYYGYQPNLDSTIMLGQQAYLLAQKKNWRADQEHCLTIMANAYGDLGDYTKAISFYFKALKIAEDLHNLDKIAYINNNIGATYNDRGDYKKALRYLQIAQKQIIAFDLSHKSADNKSMRTATYQTMGACYLHLHQLDSAEHALYIAYNDCKKFNLTGDIGAVQDRLGQLEAEKGNKAKALQFFRQAVISDKAMDDSVSIAIVCLSTANLYHKFRQQDSAVYYARKAFEVAAAGKFEQVVLNAGKALYTFYDEEHNLPQAYTYFKLTTIVKDSLYSQDKIKQLLSLDFDEKERQQELQTTQKEAQTEAENRLRTYVFSGSLGVLLLLALIFWRNSNQRKRANILLQSQNAEIEKQKKNVETTLGELRTTQAQLVQKEKMASLGELTAGIAHEIQNPLNFVNNFSEVSIELLQELKEEEEAGNKEDVIAIANDLTQNLQKIHHHGKRADSIVKGMLEHSRTSQGEKILTNINTLAEEFLNLCYHGFCAKDKNFTAELVSHFDDGLPKIEVVQQDIGRVLLNLFNNAFYAVNQKKKTEEAGYRPTVELTTFAPPSGGWGVKVKDNGNGIPDTIKDKIMQPFFTTKPTGEGTGLGLSLSYDIVVKGHGGSITVETKEGEFTEFTVTLSIS